MSFTPAHPAGLGGILVRRPQSLTLGHLTRALGTAVARRLSWPGSDAEGFPGYVDAARREGIDVNDWIERELGWIPARPVLEELVFPLLRPDFTVCEVGVGTGRWSRHLLGAIPRGRLVLIDRSEWIVNFTRGYFGASANVSSVRGDGLRLPFDGGDWADMFFSQGMFITLRLGHVLLYLNEFARCLKPGGRAVFDFIDPGTPGGWEFLKKESPRAPDVFAYHRLETIAGCCNDAGLQVERTESVGKSTYVVAVRA